MIICALVKHGLMYISAPVKCYPFFCIEMLCFLQKKTCVIYIYKIQNIKIHIVITDASGTLIVHLLN